MAKVKVVNTEEFYQKFLDGNVSWDECFGAYYVVKGRECAILMHTGKSKAAEIVALHLNPLNTGGSPVNIFNKEFQFIRTRSLKKKFLTLSINFQFLTATKEDITESRMVSIEGVKGGEGILVDIGFTRFYIEKNVNVHAILTYPEIFKGSEHTPIIKSTESPMLDNMIRKIEGENVREALEASIPTIIKEDPKNTYYMGGNWFKAMPPGFNPKEILGLDPPPTYPEYSNFNLTTESVDTTRFSTGPASIRSWAENSIIKKRQEKYSELLMEWEEWSRRRNKLYSMVDNCIERSGVGNSLFLRSTTELVAGIAKVGKEDEETYIKGGLLYYDKIRYTTAIAFTTWHRYFKENYVQRYENK